MRGSSGHGRTVFGCSLALVAFLSAVPAIAAHPPLPPGLEPVVRHLVREATRELPEGWRVEGTLIAARGIDVRLLRDGHDEVRLALRDRNEIARGTLVGRTTSFSVWCTAGQNETVARSFLDGLTRWDAGSFWAEAAVLAGSLIRSAEARRPPPRPPEFAAPLGRWDDTRRLLVWALTLGALTLAARDLCRRALPSFVAVFAVAAFVRLAWVAPGPIHANEHGIADLRGLAGAVLDGQVPVETDRYGVAYGQFVRSVAPAFGGGAEGAFRVGALSSALAAAFAGSAVFALSGSIAAGLVAGSSLALHPAAAALGPTESPFSLAACLLALALTAVGRGFGEASRSRNAWLLVAAGATACGLELGVTTLAIPIVVGALAVAIGRWSFVLAHSHTLLAGAAIIGVSAALHVASLRNVLAHAYATRSDALRLVPRRLLSLEWANGGEVIAVLALVGFAAIVTPGRRRVALALLLGTLLLLSTGLIVSGCETDVIRYVSLSWVVLAVTAGLSVSWLPPGRRTLGAAVALVAVAASSLPRLIPLHRPEARIDAWTWSIVRTFPWKSHERAIVLIPPRRMGKVISDFPDDAALAAAPSLSVIEGVPPELPDSTSCLVWISPACWRFTAAEIRNGEHEGRGSGVPGLRAECRSVWDHAAQPPPRVMAWPGAIEDNFHRVPSMQSARAGLVPCRSRHGAGTPR